MIQIIINARTWVTLCLSFESIPFCTRDCESTWIFDTGFLCKSGQPFQSLLTFNEFGITRHWVKASTKGMLMCIFLKLSFDNFQKVLTKLFFWLFGGKRWRWKFWVRCGIIFLLVWLPSFSGRFSNEWIWFILRDGFIFGCKATLFSFSFKGWSFPPFFCSIGSSTKGCFKYTCFSPSIPSLYFERVHGTPFHFSDWWPCIAALDVFLCCLGACLVATVRSLGHLHHLCFNTSQSSVHDDGFPWVWGSHIITTNHKHTNFPYELKNCREMQLFKSKSNTFNKITI